MSAAAGTQLGAALALLDQALGYTCGRLETVSEDRLGRRTPCAAWDLHDLLAHMEDSLDAFTEAASGRVPLHAGTPRSVSVARIRGKARALADAWRRPVPGDVLVAGVDLPTPLLVATAALEVTAHGWDVDRAIGARTPIPDALASGLLPVATWTVSGDDRGRRFDAAQPVPPGAPPGHRLVAALGRRPDWSTDPTLAGSDARGRRAP